MHAIRFRWLGLLLVGCGGLPTVLTTGDVTVDAGTVDGGPTVAASCATIGQKATEAELRAAVATIEGAIRGGGSNLPSVDSIAEAVSFFPNHALDTSQRAPAEAALVWFAGLEGSPLRVSELTLGANKSITPDALTFEVFRTRVGDQPARFWRPAAHFSLQQQGTTWRVVTATLWLSVAFASAAEGAALTACTTAEPPAGAPLAPTVFKGNVLMACEVTGTYTYTPGDTDTYALTGPARWELLGPTWRVTREATLRVASANIPKVDGAQDFACEDDEHTGFMLLVDALTGEVLRYTPGIRCVVC